MAGSHREHPTESDCSRSPFAVFVEERRKVSEPISLARDLFTRTVGVASPRGNFELADTLALEGDASVFRHFIEYTPDPAPTDSPEAFIAFCGVFGRGRLIAEGERDRMDDLRRFKAGSKLRIREAIARGALIGQ